MEGQKLGLRSRLGERQGSLTHSLCTVNAGAGAIGCQFMFQTLHATSQNGPTLEFVAATAGSECNIQDARSSGLCSVSL